jgi:hypothetical protein
VPSNYASGKHSIAECDRCGQRFKLVQLKKLTIKTKQVSIKVCNECWEMDHPQLRLGLYPVNDPQAVREPRPDISYRASGLTGLQIENGGGTNIDQSGFPGGGSRVIQWGWAPVGGSSGFDRKLTPNYLIGIGTINSVTVN